MNVDLPIAALEAERKRTSLASWATTTDHKRIGIMFLAATTLAMALGGLFALIIRIEHLTPTATIVDAHTYARLFTLHGVVMVWLFMIPAIPSGFGNFVLPLMVGAKDVAFPRLNLASFYVFLLGAAIVLGSLWWGAVDTGWTFYTPYSARSPDAVLPAAIGVFTVGISSIMTGINFVATVHTLRVKGLRWMKLPFFVWAVYGTSIIQVLATPVLGMALFLAGIDHAFHVGMFDPEKGGDPVLFQHLFWFYSHPAVYIMILPAMGVVSEVVCTFSANRAPSYRMIVYSTIGISLVGFVAWGHHMFVAGISRFDVAAFGVLSMLVSIFSAIKVYAWVGTMRGGRVKLRTPLAYVFAFLFLFVFGGMTGVAVATTSLDVHWHDTYFVVAHFHFIMVGGTFTAFLAGLHYWFPKITGKTYSDRAGLLGVAAVFGGFFLTFFPQFLLGNMGMPRRYFDYPSAFQPLHVTSTIGALILAAGLVWTLVYLFIAWRSGAPAGNDPWGSAGFEWRTASPPPEHNFLAPLDVTRDAYEYPENPDTELDR